MPDDYRTVRLPKIIIPDFHGNPMEYQSFVDSFGSSIEIYDVIGIISPVTLYAKLIMQETWERKLKWDEPLPTDIAVRWSAWCKDLVSVQRFSFPRCYVKENVVKYELVGIF